MRKVRKMIKAFDILEEQLVNVNETMVADMVDMNNTLVSFHKQTYHISPYTYIRPSHEYNHHIYVLTLGILHCDL